MRAFRYVERWAVDAYVGLPRSYCGGVRGIYGGVASWSGVGELDVSRNCIRTLPPALLQLPLLRRVLAAGNRIAYVHPSLHHLSRLQVRHRSFIYLLETLCFSSV